jgi:hypothetical protein
MRRPVRISPLAVAVAVGALAVVGTAAGVASRTVSLTLAGTHAKAAAKCGDAKADPYSAVGRGVAFTLVGSVRPAPTRPGWRVRVVVKRCVGGHYSKVWTGTAPGRAGGAFRIAYTPRSAGLFIARADYGRNPNVTSRKVHLHVR